MVARAMVDGLFKQAAGTWGPWRRKRIVGLVAFVALGFAGCAQQPQQLAAGHPKEYFPSSVYGAASRRVVDNGPVPHGGGQYLVGRPYTVAGQTYYPTERKTIQVGNASWYGDAFHGRLTANGEIYDRNSFSAAHPTMPLPSYARVTNLRNNTSMIVRVNDRGPFASNRIMDVSRRVAEALDFQRSGTAKVKIEYVGRASLSGSDDARLYATLRTGGPAPWTGEQPTMVAETQPPARVASIAPMVPMPRQESRAEVLAERRDEEATRPQIAHPRVEPVPSNERGRIAMRQDPPIPSHWQRGRTPDFDANRTLVKRQDTEAVRTNHAQLQGHPVTQAESRPIMPTRGGQTPLPPSRHLDLATIPGAGVPIGPLHGKPGLRLSRND